MKPRRKLPVHQYRLPLHIHREPVISKNLPHIVYYDGHWHLFRNRWKSRWRGPRWGAANISAATVTELKQRLARARDRYKFGYLEPT